MSLLHPSLITPPPWATYPGEAEPRWRWAWRGLVAYWPFWEGQGNVVHDVSGNENDGTIIDTTNQVWTAGKFGKGLDWTASQGTGVDDRVDLGNMDVESNGGITMIAVVYGDSIGSSVDNRFISKADDWSEADHYWMLGTTVTGLRMRIHADTKSDTHIAGPVVASGQWVRAAGTYTEVDGYMRLYRDGIKVGTDQLHVEGAGAVLGTDDTIPAALGNNGGGGGGNNHWQPHEGPIAMAAIWNRPLSQPEIAQIHADPFGMIRRRLRSFFFTAGVPPTTKNYYTGGLANAKRLTRGLGF